MAAFRLFSMPGLLIGLLLAWVPFAAGAALAADAAQVSNAWLRLPAVQDRPGGGFFTLQGGSEADALVAVTSPRVGRIEIHETSNENGIMRMQARNSIALPAHGEVQFAPGGWHLMLFGVQPGIKPGDKVPLTFRFRSGAELTTEAEARAPGARGGSATGPAHH